MADSLTARRLRQLLDYDPRTGIFRWRMNGRGRFMRKGARAGTVHKRGSRQICIDRVLYSSGPLAVLWMTGRWPRRLVDHANGNAGDDRWSNLRGANYSQNGANSRKRKSMSPLKGVTWDASRGQYVARIKVNYQSFWLGRFDTAREAHAAYVAAARQHFGEFARF